MENELLIDLGNYIKNQLPEERADNFHEKYCALIEKSDTSDVWRQFAIWLLVDEEHGVIRFTKPNSEQHNAILQVADLYIDDYQNKKVWKDAENEARAVAESIRDERNIYSAVCAACCAADFDAGLSAGLAATAYGAYAIASNLSYYDAYDAHCERMANKLIELIKAAPFLPDSPEGTYIKASQTIKRIVTESGDERLIDFFPIMA